MKFQNKLNTFLKYRWDWVFDFNKKYEVSIKDPKLSGMSY